MNFTFLNNKANALLSHYFSAENIWSGKIIFNKHQFVVYIIGSLIYLLKDSSSLSNHIVCLNVLEVAVFPLKFLQIRCFSARF